MVQPMEIQEVSFIQCPSLMAAVYLLSKDANAFIGEEEHNGQVYWKFRGTEPVKQGVEEWKSNQNACSIPVVETEDLLHKLGYDISARRSSATAGSRRRSGKRVRMTDDMLSFIGEAVSRTPDVSPAAIKAALEDKFGSAPSYQSVRNRVLQASS